MASRSRWWNGSLLGRVRTHTGRWSTWVARSVGTVVAALVLISGTSAAGEDTDTQSPHPALKSPVVSEMERVIRQYPSTHGRSMTSAEFSSFTGQYADKMPRDREALRAIMQHLQSALATTRPAGAYSIDDIREVFEFKRASLTSLTVRFTTEATFDPELGREMYGVQDQRQRMTIHFVEDRGRLYRDELFETAHASGAEYARSTHLRRAFDGHDEYVFDTDHGFVQANKNETAPQGRHYWPAIGGLLGDQGAMSGLSYYEDMEQLLTGSGSPYVLPELQKVGEVSAVVVRYGIPECCTVWLDPERMFCPLKVETSRVVGDGIQFREVTVFSDHAKDAAGMYLPHRIVTTGTRQLQDGSWKEVYRKISEAAELAVNQPVDEKLFTAEGVFPFGTPVYDSRISMSYFSGSPDIIRIDDAIDNAVKSAMQADLKADDAARDVEETVSAGGGGEEHAYRPAADDTDHEAGRYWPAALVCVAILGLGVAGVLLFRRKGRT